MKFIALVIFALSILTGVLGCEDVLDFCPDLLSSCKESHFVRGACEKTCGLCIGNVYQKDCHDKFKLCPELKSSCKSSFVRRHCERTCGLCGGNSITWTPCSKSCGYGTSVGTTVNGTKEYKACNTQACSLDICPHGQRRREIPHACCSADSVTSCGIPSDGIKYPWLVAVKRDYMVCSGAVISRRWILTAMQCLQDVDMKDLSDVEIYAGIEKLPEFSAKENTISFPNSRLRKVEDIVIHPDFEFPNADIVLVKLTTNLVFSEAIQPICLPGGEVAPTDTKCFISGWDISDEQFPSLTYVPREAVVSNFDLDVCRMTLVKPLNASGEEKTVEFIKEKNSWLCAGNLHTAKDSCVGFSGAPLVCQRCSSCSYYVAGILSFGLYPCSNSLAPLIYTKVRHYERWIKTITGVSAAPKSCSHKVGP